MEDILQKTEPSSIANEYPIQEHLEAYLDIETTGLSRDFHEITVVGVYRVGASSPQCIQLVGDEISAETVLKAMEGVDTVYTYNGSRFDLPFIYYRLGIKLTEHCDHRDLMLDCWRNNLFGGLKRVEKQLGIRRQLSNINGFDAVRLWWRYINDGDATALATLIRYNREDIQNLKVLKEILLDTQDAVSTASGQR